MKRVISAYGRDGKTWRRSRTLRGRLVAIAVAALTAVLLPTPALAQNGDDTVLDARDALRRKDASRLAAARAAMTALNHPLAQWIDYWELSTRLNTAQQSEIDAFYARWRGSYVEDRLRNDWLLELGRRRDWRALRTDYAQFVMNDDREVTCYALLADHLAGTEVREPALAAWLAQRDGDDGCAQMAAALFQAGRFTEDDVWRKARVAADANRPKVVRQAVGLLGGRAALAVGDAVDGPVRFLSRLGDAVGSRTDAELATLALIRLAASDPDQTATLLAGRWESALPAQHAAWVWAAIGKQASLKLQPDAADRFQRAQLFAARGTAVLVWPEETLAWQVRAALRGNPPRWTQVLQAISQLSPSEQRDPAWIYWHARALQAVAQGSANAQADARRAQAQALYASIAGQLHFYGALAAEELGRGAVLPPRPAPLTPAEREAAAQNPALARALALIGLGLRAEGVREWNFTLRGMDDRALLAAAQRACEREVWDRCINTSDRTRAEVDLEQRFPMPFRREVVARARDIGIDPAFVYGLIRQESRFIVDARSSVGASGLMQVMPATAKVVARRIGLDLRPDMLADRDTNLTLGISYLKMVLDDFAGAEALAAAAYNAGPGRPRRWREGPLLEPAIWAENIPFAETRDYVKKVLANRLWYAALLSNAAPPSLKARLGRAVGPRESGSSPPDRDLP